MLIQSTFHEGVPLCDLCLLSPVARYCLLCRLLTVPRHDPEAGDSAAVAADLAEAADSVVAEGVDSAAAGLPEVASAAVALQAQASGAAAWRRLASAVGAAVPGAERVRVGAEAMAVV